MELYAIKNIETGEYVARYDYGKSYSKNLPRFWFRRSTCENFLNDKYNYYSDDNHIIVLMTVEEVNE